MAEMKLIPFKIESIQTVAPEIPYGIKQINAPELWEKGETGEGIVVAILDTGIDLNHPDLKGNIIDGRNFTSEGRRDDYSDGNGHGTHVAGTIAGVMNGSGVIGVAPDAKLLICKVLDSEGSGSYHGIIKGIEFASNWKGPNGERVRVMNMSLGGTYDDPKLYQAILEAVSKGILIVVASGNEGDNDESTMEYGYPSLYNECITISACDENKNLAPFSNNSLQVDCIASGVNVMSTYPESQYARLSGTSMATPHISGAMALIIKYGEKQFKRTLTESEIYALLAKTCERLDLEISSQGHGLPDLTLMYKNC
jgi:major intracellular serine protease